MTENAVKWTPGPWSPMWQNSRAVSYGGAFNHWELPVAVGEWPGGGNSICVVHMGGPGATESTKEAVEANARLIAAAPEMAEALQAEEEADRLFDAADEYTHRAEGEGWLNDPTGSMHVTEAWDRARQAREHAKELRRAALLKAGG